VSEESVTGSHQKKIAVSLHSFVLSNIFSHTWSQISIDSGATNSDLAKEIADYLNRASKTLVVIRLISPHTLSFHYNNPTVELLLLQIFSFWKIPSRSTSLRSTSPSEAPLIERRGL